MKNVTAQVNNGHENSIVKIDEVEKKYNAKYVGQMALRTIGGGWSEDVPGEIFWQETPPQEGFSNYLALFKRGGSLYITSGASAVEGVINGTVADDGEIIYSRYRHDMRYSQDKSTWIDGGRDYVRGGAKFRPVILKVINGEWFQLEDGDIDYEVPA